MIKILYVINSGLPLSIFFVLSTQRVITRVPGTHWNRTFYST